MVTFDELLGPLTIELVRLHLFDNVIFVTILY